MCDTDSMAIIASEHGGIVPCPNGRLRTKDGRPGVRALSWAEVDAIRARFESLNPYDRDIVPGSVLKIEKENFDANRKQRQLFIYGISAKRYALFVREPDGSIVIVKPLEHGLGNLLNPIDLDSADSQWIRDIWNYLVSEAVGQPIEKPYWLDRASLSRISVSSPHVWRQFRKRGSYREGVKPFNFLLSAQITPFGHPDGVDPTKFHLLAP